MAHEHIYVKHPNPKFAATMVCCDECGFAVPKSILRPHVVREFSLAITQAQREQLKPLLQTAPDKGHPALIGDGDGPR